MDSKKEQTQQLQISQQSERFLPQLIQATKKNDIKRIVRLFGQVTPALIKSSPNQLSAVKKDLGHDDLQEILIRLLVNVNDYFNVGKGLNTTQIIELSEMIIKNYWFLKIEHVIDIFNRAKVEAKLYDRLDGGIIFGWFSKYWDEQLDNIHSDYLVRKSGEEKTSDIPMNSRFKLVTDSLIKRFSRESINNDFLKKKKDKKNNKENA